MTCFAILAAFAQPHHHKARRLHEKLTPEMREKIKAYKVTFFTEELELTAEESEGFLPIFNEYEEKIYTLKKEYRPNKQPNLDNTNEADIQAMIDKHFEFKQKELDLKKEYANKCSKVIPLRKVLIINHLEHEFRRKIVKEYKRRKD